MKSKIQKSKPKSKPVEYLCPRCGFIFCNEFVLSRIDNMTTLCRGCYVKEYVENWKTFLSEETGWDLEKEEGNYACFIKEKKTPSKIIKFMIVIDYSYLQKHLCWEVVLYEETNSKGKSEISTQRFDKIEDAIDVASEIMENLNGN